MPKKKLWGGRFHEKTASPVEQYTQSISYDKKMYAQDIAGSKAHASMLGRQGILTSEEVLLLLNGLDSIQKEIETDTFPWKIELEDVHMNIESRLTDLIGTVGEKLHTGRSRNDQVALDFRLFVSDNISLWKRQLLELIGIFVAKAEEYKDTILPGFTHLQPAQPVSLAQHLLAYAWMFKRDVQRVYECNQRVRISPLGAAALSGTTYNIDPFFIANELHMYGVFDNSMDAVSDRDFVIEALFCASVIMMHLSRFCEELIIWSNPAFGFVQLPDAYATGSSIMPQKKNPDVAEIMRGKVGRVYGALYNMLTILKALPLTYNRDLQEDKEPFFDTNTTIQSSLSIMADMLAAITFNKNKMASALSDGYLNATELADYLVTKGLSFREAHHTTGSIVALAEQQKIPLEELSLQDFQSICDKIESDVFHVLDYHVSIERRKSTGGTGYHSIEKQIEKLKSWLTQ